MFLCCHGRYLQQCTFLSLLWKMQKLMVEAGDEFTCGGSSQLSEFLYLIYYYYFFDTREKTKKSRKDYKNLDQHIPKAKHKLQCLQAKGGYYQAVCQTHITPTK